MKVLVTSSRIPAAIELIRTLGAGGHTVFAADAFRSAPGGHSKHAQQRFVTPSPRFEPLAYVEAVVDLVRRQRIDRLMPSFEEVFYLAKHRERLEPFTEPFFPSLKTLRQLHDKRSFLGLAAELGLEVEPMISATSRAELASAVAELPRYMARAAYSRGGVTLLTNHGPLAGEVTLDECEPTPANPFVVQPFLEGLDLCTYGIAHHGRYAAHVAYVHPMTMEHAGGIVFESVDHPASLEAARRIVEATGYHGQISIDFIQTEDRLVALECNPRPTAGLAVMPDEMLCDAMLDRRAERTRVAPPGMRRQLSLALIRNMLVHPETIPAGLEELLSGDPDVYAAPGDVLPLLYQVLAYGRVLGYRLRTGKIRRSDIMQGYFYDITWDGEEIP